MQSWIQRHRHGVGRVRSLIEELKSAERIDIAMLTVANHQLRALTTD